MLAFLGLVASQLPPKPTYQKIPSYAEFQMSSPIGICPVESLFTLDQWTAAKECKNTQYQSEPKRKPRNCKKDVSKFMSQTDQNEEMKKKFQAEHAAQFAEY